MYFIQTENKSIVHRCCSWFSMWVPWQTWKHQSIWSTVTILGLFFQFNQFFFNVPSYNLKFPPILPPTADQPKHLFYRIFAWSNWTTWALSQILQCIRQIWHNAPFCNRNVHTCAHFCYKMVHCGIWDCCIVEFVRYVYCIFMYYMLMLISLKFIHEGHIYNK